MSSLRKRWEDWLYVKASSGGDEWVDSLPLHLLGSISEVDADQLAHEYVYGRWSRFVDKVSLLRVIPTGTPPFCMEEDIC